MVELRILLHARPHEAALAHGHHFARQVGKLGHLQQRMQVKVVAKPVDMKGRERLPVHRLHAMGWKLRGTGTLNIQGS
jgi:hypothetical protein